MPLCLYLSQQSLVFGYVPFETCVVDETDLIYYIACGVFRRFLHDGFSAAVVPSDDDHAVLWFEEECAEWVKLIVGGELTDNTLEGFHGALRHYGIPPVGSR